MKVIKVQCCAECPHFIKMEHPIRKSSVSIYCRKGATMNHALDDSTGLWPERQTAKDCPLEDAEEKA